MSEKLDNGIFSNKKGCNQMSYSVSKLSKEEARSERERRIKESLNRIREGDVASTIRAVKRREEDNQIAEMSSNTITSSNREKDRTEELMEMLIKDGLGELSITTLASLMESGGEEEVPPSVRAKVATYVIDRILGKPVQREEIKQEITTKAVSINIQTIHDDIDLRGMGLVYDETMEV